MRLGAFLDAAYSMLVDEFVRLGTDLQTALKELQDYRAGGGPEHVEGEVVEAQARGQKQRDDAAVAAENEQALAQLNRMMGGIAR